MSRERRSLRFAPAVAGIALALAGCSAGQISQTAGMEAAVNGGTGNAGTIAVRDIQLAYPKDGVYERNAAAVVLGTVVNTGQTDDELVSVTSPAGAVSITGDKGLAAGRALIAELPAGGLPTSAVATTPSNPATSGSATAGSTATGSVTSGSQTSGSQTSGSATSGSQTSGSTTTTTTTTTTATTATTSAAPKSI
ncbi:MAG: hypothetical protein ABW224_19450, partial [Kibdelosporangium sp.]